MSVSAGNGGVLSTQIAGTESLLSIQLPSEIEAKITYMDGCWIWTGARRVRNYGSVQYGERSNRKSALAHKYVYELLVGPVPEGLELDHTCREQRCVNPDHLEPVTHLVNSRRALAKTHCKHGHPLSGDNLYVWHDKRACRRCAIDRATAWNKKRDGAPIVYAEENAQ